MRVEECFKRRSLRKEDTGPGLWQRSLEISTEKMKRSEALLIDRYYEESIFQSYTSMFHAARAVLFHDNVVEKSHVCVVSYLEERYSSVIGLDLIHWLDENRIERHEIIYGMGQIFKVEDEARTAFQRCGMFLGSISALLSKNA